MALSYSYETKTKSEELTSDLSFTANHSYQVIVVVREPIQIHATYKNTVNYTSKSGICNKEQLSFSSDLL